MRSIIACVPLEFMHLHDTNEKGLEVPCLRCKRQVFLPDKMVQAVKKDGNETPEVLCLICVAEDIENSKEPKPIIVIH